MEGRPSRQYLDAVRRLVDTRLRGFAVEVYLFGSWARGDARRISDIDVAILPKGDLPASLLNRLREDLEESTIPYPVEVVDLRETTDEFKARVLQEGVRWSA